MRQRALENQTVRLLMDQPLDKRQGMIDDLKAQRAEAKGPIANLSDQGMASVEQTIRQAQREAEVTQNKNFNAWNRDADSALSRLQKNLPIPDMELDTLNRNAALLNDQRASDKIAAIQDLSKVQSDLRGKA